MRYKPLRESKTSDRRAAPKVEGLAKITNQQGDDRRSMYEHVTRQIGLKALFSSQEIARHFQHLIAADSKYVSREMKRFALLMAKLYRENIDVPEFFAALTSNRLRDLYIEARDGGGSAEFQALLNETGMKMSGKDEKKNRSFITFTAVHQLHTAMLNTVNANAPRILKVHLDLVHPVRSLETPEKNKGFAAKVLSGEESFEFELAGVVHQFNLRNVEGLNRVPLLMKLQDCNTAHREALVAAGEEVPKGHRSYRLVPKADEDQMHVSYDKSALMELENQQIDEQHEKNCKKAEGEGKKPPKRSYKRAPIVGELAARAAFRKIFKYKQFERLPDELRPVNDEAAMDFLREGCVKGDEEPPVRSFEAESLNNNDWERHDHREKLEHLREYDTRFALLVTTNGISASVHYRKKVGKVEQPATIDEFDLLMGIDTGVKIPLAICTAEIERAPAGHEVLEFTKLSSKQFQVLKGFRGFEKERLKLTGRVETEAAKIRLEGGNLGNWSPRVDEFIRTELRVMKATEEVKDAIAEEAAVAVRSAKDKKSKVPMTEEMFRKVKSNIIKKTAKAVARNKWRRSVVLRHAIDKFVDQELPKDKKTAVFWGEDFGPNGKKGGHMQSSLSGFRCSFFRHSRCRVYITREFRTSMLCSRCFNILNRPFVPKRNFTCKNCGLVVHRDLNAGHNMITVGRAQHFGGDLPKIGYEGKEDILEGEEKGREGEENILEVKDDIGEGGEEIRKGEDEKPKTSWAELPDVFSRDAVKPEKPGGPWTRRKKPEPATVAVAGAKVAVSNKKPSTRKKTPGKQLSRKRPAPTPTSNKPAAKRIKLNDGSSSSNNPSTSKAAMKSAAPDKEAAVKQKEVDDKVKTAAPKAAKERKSRKRLFSSSDVEIVEDEMSPPPKKQKVGEAGKGLGGSTALTTAGKCDRSCSSSSVEFIDEYQLSPPKNQGKAEAGEPTGLCDANVSRPPALATSRSSEKKAAKPQRDENSASKPAKSAKKMKAEKNQPLMMEYLKNLRH